MTREGGRSILGPLGAVAAAAIVVASLIVRSGGPADPAADVVEQRAAVERFHDLVRAGRWDEVFRSTTEPPGRTAAAFARLMREGVRDQGKVTRIEAGSIRLLRSRTVPMLEVRERVTFTSNGRERTIRTVSYFARRDDRWLFAFSAPG